MLAQQLTKQGMTLREVVDRQAAELNSKATKTKSSASRKLGPLGERARVRFSTKDSSFDFVQILQCSASLRPLL